MKDGSQVLRNKQTVEQMRYLIERIESGAVNVDGFYFEEPRNDTDETVNELTIAYKQKAVS